MADKKVKGTEGFPYTSRREIVSEEAGDMSKVQSQWFDLAEGRDGVRLEPKTTTGTLRFWVPGIYGRMRNIIKICFK